VILLSSQQCAAKTLAGKRCKNRIAKGSTCFRHSKPIKRFKLQDSGGRWESVAVGLGTTAASTQLIEQIIEVIHFVANHWEAITKVVKTFATYSLVSVGPDMTKRYFILELDSENIDQSYEFRLRIDRLSKEEINEFSRSFDEWFVSIPLSVQRKTIKQFGRHAINALRHPIYS
jgi:hypothetical protein